MRAISATMSSERRGWRQRGGMILGRLREAWREYQRDYAPFLAAAMVYYALLSLVPLLLLLLPGLGLMLRYSQFAHAAEQQVLTAVEESFGAELPGAISQMLDALRQSSIITTVVITGAEFDPTQVEPTRTFWILRI